MWPQVLQMTRDECRGILRRLELESYSHVISVFRAQGGLNDTKAKLLEELRTICHISQDRHRSEARRVANDEQLSTIAETISGPNTWQEWSREGRRSFPMLPRIAPQTALALIANNVATETAEENSKLPYPSYTGAAVAEEQAAYARDSSAWDTERIGVPVVTSDPFKMPDIPAGTKKNLKRIMPDNQTGSSKKRIVNDTSPTNQQQQQQNQYQHITANTNVSPPNSPSSNIRKLYNNHSKLQQQRYFHQQQVQKQKAAAKQTKQTKAATGAKRQATPAKSGRRAQKLQQKEQEIQNMIIQQHEAEQLQHAQQQQHHLQTQQQQARNIAFNDLQCVEEFDEQYLPMDMPQIAASKKDITKNLTKLQMPASVMSPTPAAMRIAPHEIHPYNPSTSTSPTSAALPASSIIIGKADKQLISTPVQKYIVEDRQPPQPAVQVQVSSTPQIMTLPQLSAAATKLRAINTTILPPGTKLTPKKLPPATLVTPLIDHATSGSGTSAIITSQPQVFSIIDGTTITTSAGGVATPTHTPPAVIQLHGSSGDSPQQPTQGKVLTTKLLPIVLSGSSAGSATGGCAASSSPSTSNITKIETLNNGATMITAATGSAGGSSVTSSPGLGTTIIKNLPPSMLIGGQSVSTSGTLISTLGSGANVFRKPPNFIKTTGLTGTSKISSTFNTNTSNTGPQIISNVKLSSAITTTATTTQQQFFQQQLKNATATGMRTSVKICKSPNGKMFIQSANTDPSKAKLQGSLQHKLISANALMGATAGSVTSTMPQRRVAIQKVQIIPASMSSSGSLPGTMQLTQKSTTLTIGGNKSNMIFVPTTSGRSAMGTFTGTFTKNLTPIGVSNIMAKNQQQQHNQSVDVSKPNVVVIGASTMPPQNMPQQLQQSSGLKTTTTFIDNNKISSTSSSAAATTTSSVQLENSQMITEDTPVDILNMPIIVDTESSSTNVVGNNIGDTVTVLSSDLIETTSNASSQSQQQSTVILDATDWEMELDQATAVAAATKARTQRRSTSSGRQQRTSTSDQQEGQTDNVTIVLDDSFEDVIVEEEEIVDGGQAQQEVQVQQSEDISTTIHADTNDSIVMLEEDHAGPKVVEDVKSPQDQLQLDDSMEVTNAEQNPKKTTDDEVIREEQGSAHSHENIECETDAGFDETIDTEIDENTAIEYIEEEHSSITYEEQHDRHDVNSSEITEISGICESEKPISYNAQEESKDYKNNTINCRFAEFLSTSGDESDVAAQEQISTSIATSMVTTTTTQASNSSQDEQ